MRVFLTGGTGFVGSHVIPALLAGGHAVRALRRRPAPDASVTAGLEWVTGDVLDPRSLADAAAGCEVAIHAAAELSFRRADQRRQREVNVVGTRNVLRAAREAGVRRFVHTSSIAAIGRPARGHVADERTRYDWPPGFTYQESKRDSEREALAAAADGFEVLALNPAFVLGPDEPQYRTLPLVRAVKYGLARVAPPGGVSICDVRDVAAAHVAALDRGRSGERYVLAGPYLSYREMLALYARALGAPPPRLTVPERLVRFGALALVGIERIAPVLPVPAAYLGEVPVERAYSSAKAIEELGYRERPADETIGDSVAWYRSAGLV